VSRRAVSRRKGAGARTSAGAARTGAPRLVGVIHLAPLPGSPRARGDATAAVDAIAEATRGDALALERAGFDAVVVENFGDAPFFPTRVEPITVAAMTRCVLAAREAKGLVVGVNVLRNDAASAMAIAVQQSARVGDERHRLHLGADHAREQRGVGRDEAAEQQGRDGLGHARGEQRDDRDQRQEGQGAVEVQLRHTPPRTV
jgi:hypothetical protein